ncbi:uncharacterized protein LOC142236020 [Haematobia irritans]|uniref:uncharacterized protein LOC142236020 n=1 Tax=Haematobia irritans TaxID=7368 RepID=UPI003F502294
MKKDGKSLGEIAENVSRPRSSVQYVIQNYEKRGSIKMLLGRRRQKIIDLRLGRKIEGMVKQDPKISVVKIAESIENHENIIANPQTIRNFLHMNQYKACVARRKPYIPKKNVMLLIRHEV